MFDVDSFTALFAGLLTFVAPCTFPLIPGYIAFLGGVFLSDDKDSRKRMIFHALLFVLGFSFIFIIFGIVSGALGSFLIEYRYAFSRIGGTLVILFGLSMLHIIPQFQFSLSAGKIPSWIRIGSKSGAFILGSLFALGWSPCLGPILGTILILAGNSGTILHGAYLLMLFSIGLGLPFLLVALLFERATNFIHGINKYLPTLSTIGGIIFILIGLLMIFGKYGMLTELGTFVLPHTWYESIMDHL